MLGNYLIVHDELFPSDVIHVIAGDDYRTDYAIELYKLGYAKTIFFTGGWCKFHGYYHGEHGMELALSQGVPREAIAFDESPVASTYDEAVLLKKYLVSRQPIFQSIIVVSDPYHMRRARWTYKFIFGNETQILMAPVPMDQTPFQEKWWADKTSKKYVKEEFIKLVYYFFRYQLGLKWLTLLNDENP